MLAGIGEPELVDTRNDPRLSRIFGNKRHQASIPAFREFYGMEDAIEQIVAFFSHAAQGLEEKKQILYLLGPVGGGKSSIAERLKQLMEQRAVLRDQGLAGQRIAARPVRRRTRTAALLEEEYGIPRRYLQRHHVARGRSSACEEFGGDIRKFRVVQAPPVRAAADRASPRPSRATRTTRTSRRWSARSTSASSRPIAQNDPDAYSYSGGLCLANQGLLEFVEMFKAPIKMLHPLLTATQEGNFKGTEGFGAIPFDGIVLAHSNESRVEDASATTRTTRRSSTASTSSRCRTACASSEEVKIYEKLLAQLVAVRGAVRARHARDDGAVLGADAPEGAGELEHLLEDAGLRRREPEGHRPEGQDAARNTATTPASTKA